MTAAKRIAELTPAERGHLTLDAIEALDNIDSGEWTVADAHALLGDELAQGVVLYANLLEATLVMTRGADVPEIRESCRTTARRIAEPKA
jgi:hypothetical protein